MFNLLSSVKPIGREEFLDFEGRPVHIFREAFRRRLSLSVSMTDEIQMRVAKSTSRSEILRFLDDQREWILAFFEKNSRWRIKHPRKLYREGEEFLYLGRNLRLHFEETPRTSGEIFVNEDLLVVRIPNMHARAFDPQNSHPEMAKPIRDFYKHQAQSFIEKKVAEYSKAMQLFPTSLSYRSQKTRWGSCSSRGHLSFNWRLIVAPQRVIEYVIVHELAHLRHHDHSQNFWQLVEHVIPDCKKLRRWLKENQFEADFLAKKSQLWPIAA